MHLKRWLTAVIGIGVAYLIFRFGWRKVKGSTHQFFPPYSKETIEVAKYAREKNIKVISITNKESSPITFYSTEVLLVKSENMLYTNSFAAISVLINAIATACAVRNKANAKKIFEEAVKFKESQDVIIS